MRLRLYRDDLGADIQECPGAIAHMGADVKAQCAGMHELQVKSQKPSPVEGFPVIDQLGAEQTETAFQVFHPLAIAFPRLRGFLQLLILGEPY
jgi:hypothetical protein